MGGHENLITGNLDVLQKIRVNYALEDFPSQSRRFELIDWVLEFLN
jgi:hypothetical protein